VFNLYSISVARRVAVDPKPPLDPIAVRQCPAADWDGHRAVQPESPFEFSWPPGLSMADERNNRRNGEVPVQFEYQAAASPGLSESAQVIAQPEASQQKSINLLLDAEGHLGIVPELCVIASR
jgi:hypothetical protein